MKIEKFTHVDNGKTIYAVIDEPNKNDAMLAVCRYKKDAKETFMSTHHIYTGLIKGKKLYRININIADTFDKNLTH